MRLSVIICTYNRADLLKFCLDSILKTGLNLDKSEVIVIDNNSTDHTPDVVRGYKRVRYIKEEEQGLSVARNRGMSEAINNWVVYIDDDCKVHANIFEEIGYTISNYPFKMFTGIYKAWYIEKPPKWLPYSVGNYPFKGDLKPQELSDYKIAGGVMVIYRPVFKEVLGGFPSYLGMKGDQIRYGEEAYIEYEYRKKNIPLGINPKVIINHYVFPKKYTIRWHLKANLEWGRSAFLAHGMSHKTVLFKVLRGVIYGMTITPLRSKSIKKAIIITIGSIYYYLGYIKAKFFFRDV